MTDFQWLEGIGFWAMLGLVFVIAMLESLAMVGLIVPGVALLFMLAATAASLNISIYGLILAAAIGAFIGDSASFWLGRHYQHRITNWKPLKKRAQLVRRSEEFCKKHGVKGLLISRFIGPLRPLAPLSAGILQFPKPQFFLIATIGALLWAPVYIGPGYFVGTWPGFQSHLLIIAAATILLPEMLLATHHQLKKLQSNHLELSFVLFTITLILGSMLVFEQAKLPSCNGLCSINTTATHWIQASKVELPGHVRDGIVQTFQLITKTGNTLPIFFMLAITLWEFQKRKAFRAALALIVITGAPFALKAIFDIDRPPGLHQEITQSFPSGHTYFPFIIVTCCTLLGLAQAVIIQRLLIYWTCSVALSRLVLEVHWPLDILGGYLLAIASSCVLYWAYSQDQARNNTLISSR